MFQSTGGLQERVGFFYRSYGNISDGKLTLWPKLILSRILRFRLVSYNYNRLRSYTALRALRNGSMLTGPLSRFAVSHTHNEMTIARNFMADSSGGVSDCQGEDLLGRYANSCHGRYLSAEIIETTLLCSINPRSFLCYSYVFREYSTFNSHHTLTSSRKS